MGCSENATVVYKGRLTEHVMVVYQSALRLYTATWLNFEPERLEETTCALLNMHVTSFLVSMQVPLNICEFHLSTVLGSMNCKCTF